MLQSASLWLFYTQNEETEQGWTSCICCQISTQRRMHPCQTRKDEKAHNVFGGFSLTATYYIIRVCSPAYSGFLQCSDSLKLQSFPSITSFWSLAKLIETELKHCRNNTRPFHSATGETRSIALLLLRFLNKIDQQCVISVWQYIFIDLSNSEIEWNKLNTPAL